MVSYLIENFDSKSHNLYWQQEKLSSDRPNSGVDFLHYFFFCNFMAIPLSLVETR